MSREMKEYKKKHSNLEALSSHVSKIKKRGGVYSIDRKTNTITYSFPDSDENPDRSKYKKGKEVHQSKLVTGKRYFSPMGNVITFDKIIDGTVVSKSGAYNVASTYYEALRK